MRVIMIAFNLTDHNCSSEEILGEAEDYCVELTLDVLNTEVGFKENQFLIAPNPFANEIVITSQSQKLNQVEMFDLKGRLIRVRKNLSSNSHTIFTGDLESGTYFIKVTDDKNSFTKKIIKM